jgi:hypothetical protein
MDSPLVQPAGSIVGPGPAGLVQAGVAYDPRPLPATACLAPSSLAEADAHSDFPAIASPGNALRAQIEYIVP